METNIERYFIEIAFKGTNYHGWQIQNNAISVQEMLDKALSRVFRQEISSLGCGRTDAGVHAKQLFAHFDVVLFKDPVKGSDLLSEEQKKQQLERNLRGINALLPQDIAALSLF